MVDIQSKDIVDRIWKDTKVQPAMAIPRALNPSIQPVLEVNPQPLIKVILDNALNDSDKRIIVPAGKSWKVLYGLARLTTTADVGNRQLRFRILDISNNAFVDLNALNVQAASTTDDYNFGQFGDVAESVAVRHTIPIPVNLVLDSGFQIHVLDTAGIEPAADDLLLRFVVLESDTIEV